MLIFNNCLLHTLASECIFSILFFMHFPMYWQGEFVWQSRDSLDGEHVLLASSQWWSLLCHWLSSMRLIKKSHHFFSFKSCLFLSQWHCFTKRQQPIRFQSFVKITNQIRGKWRTTFQLCRNQLSIGAVKYLHRPKHPVFEWLDFFHFKMDVAIKW